MSAQSKTPTADAAAAVVGAMPKRSERRIYKNDPFTTKDGRYIGHDGFVLPRDFEEFYERFPAHVRKWVGRHAERSATNQDLEDWTNDLLVHLMRLPEKSKYRQIGKSDVVQTFDPVRQHGANAARFWNYINQCLANKFRSMRSKRLKDALCHPKNLSFDTQPNGRDLGSVDDEYCHANSACLQSAARATEKLAFDWMRLQEFEDFVPPQDTDVLAAMDAVQATQTHREAAESLGITHEQFGRRLSRIRLLRTCFLKRQPVPRRRRPYNKRVAKAKRSAAALAA
jgi:hypothetical protein